MADTAVNTRQVGRVKWFNNQSGYGFITYTSSTGSDEDVFVHHSALLTSGDQFRYLVQGEYVEFETTQVEKSGSSPRIVAKDVRGMNGGMLMCETRHERRQSQQQRRENSDSQADNSSTGSGSRQQRSRPRFRGGGPRVGDRLNVGGTEWKLVRGSNGSNNRRGRPNKRSRTDDSRDNH